MVCLDGMQRIIVLLWIIELRTPTSLGMCCGVGKRKMVTNTPPASGCAFPPWPALLPSHTYACPPATCLLRCMTIRSVRAPRYNYGAAKCSLCGLHRRARTGSWAFIIQYFNFLDALAKSPNVLPADSFIGSISLGMFTYSYILLAHCDYYVV